MAQGITFTKNRSGGYKSITLDWKKYGTIVTEALHANGIELPTDKKQAATIAGLKAKGYLTAEEFREEGLKQLRNFYKENGLC